MMSDFNEQLLFVSLKNKIRTPQYIAMYEIFWTRAEKQILDLHGVSYSLRGERNK